jgi:hypothetical protein
MTTIGRFRSSRTRPHFLRTRWSGVYLFATQESVESLSQALPGLIRAEAAVLRLYRELIGWKRGVSNRDPGIGPTRLSDAPSRNLLLVRYLIQWAPGAHIPGSSIDRPVYCSRSLEFWPSR